MGQGNLHSWNGKLRAGQGMDWARDTPDHPSCPAVGSDLGTARLLFKHPFFHQNQLNGNQSHRPTAALQGWRSLATPRTCTQYPLYLFPVTFAPASQ